MSEIEFKTLVIDLAARCVDVLVNERLVKRPATFKKSMVIEVKNIRRGWGGLTKAKKPRISIPKWYMTATGEFREYASIAKDSVIGGFVSDNPVDHIKAVVAHEVAHAADWWNGDISHHGFEWRVLYRKLRIELFKERRRS